jgi:predicted ATPase/class 3 adenylate cyclase
MVEQPFGTVTLVFTDIEGSTRLLRELGREPYQRALARHRTIVREACARHDGYEVDYEGDSFFYAFRSAGEAVAAVEEFTAALADGLIRMRVGIHTGEPSADPPKYVGLDVHLAARVMAAAHGGQVLVTETTAALVGNDSPAASGLRDLGRHHLKDLGEPLRLYQFGDGLFPPPRSLNRTNLPVPSSPLIGRRGELAELVAHVRDGARVVTVTGPGGTGKTRLALEAVAEVAGDFADGVFWVSLAALRNPALVLPAITEVARVERLVDLSESEALFMLDNVEHLLAAVPDLATLPASAPKVRLLATSRAPLRIRGEHLYALDPLSEEDAEAFFIARASETGSAIKPDATIAEVCRRLDRLPLALELAAARLRILDPSALLERLDRRLPLLTGGASDAPDRQRTLRATIEWSDDLLDDHARSLLAGLGIFAGSFTVEMAETICGADLDALQMLAESSLLNPVAGSRFLMLETIREYARERLAENDDGTEMRRRHAKWCVALVEHAEPQLTGGAQAEWLERLDAAEAEIRAALEWALDAEPAQASRIAAGCWRYWNIRGRLVEATLSVDAALSRETAPDLRMRLLQARTAAALDMADGEAARVAAAEHLELARRVGDRDHVFRGLNGLGVAALLSADYEEAASLFVAAVEAAPDEHARAVATGNRAIALAWLRDYEDARARLVDACAAFKRLGNEIHLSTMTARLAGVDLLAGRTDDALRAAREALERVEPFAFAAGVAQSLDVVAGAMAASGDPERAARIHGATDALYSRAQTRDWIIAPWDTHHASRLRVRETLGDETYAALHAEGASLSLHEAAALAGTIAERTPP